MNDIEGPVAEQGGMNQVGIHQPVYGVNLGSQATPIKPRAYPPTNLVTRE
jgi:hypothetical protein